MKKFCITWILTATLLLIISIPGFALDIQPVENSVVKAGAIANIIKYTPNMTVKALAGRLDSDLVEFSSGRRISVGMLRSLEAAQQKMLESVPGRRLPVALKVKPAATGTIVRTSADINAALQRPDSDTVQFPSGRLATVGQMKFVQPLVEKKLGKKLSMLPQGPNLSGPGIEIIKISNATTQSNWKIIFQKPDSTVIESPNGKRITVGDLKQAMAKSTKSMPNKTAPQPPGRRP
jgi:hypothetical protein